MEITTRMLINLQFNTVYGHLTYFQNQYVPQVCDSHPLDGLLEADRASNRQDHALTRVQTTAKTAEVPHTANATVNVL